MEYVGQIIARLRHFLLEGKPSFEPVGLHALIEGASRVNGLALEKAQASLHLRLEAEMDVVQADRVQRKVFQIGLVAVGGITLENLERLLMGLANARLYATQTPGLESGSGFRVSAASPHSPA
jgi:hypothetical protein